jgi:hypothetical protein
MKDIFNRNCPTCNREILYKGYEGHRVASKSNTSCKSCIALRNEIFEIETNAYTKAIEYIQIIFGQNDEENLNFVNIFAFTKF